MAKSRGSFWRRCLVALFGSGSGSGSAGNADSAAAAHADAMAAGRAPAVDAFAAIVPPETIMPLAALDTPAATDAAASPPARKPAARNLRAAQLQSVAKLNTPVGRKPRIAGAANAVIKDRPVTTAKRPKKTAPKRHVWLAAKPIAVTTTTNVIALPVANKTPRAPQRPAAARLARVAA